MACIFLYISITLSSSIGPENTWIGTTFVYSGKETTVYQYLFELKDWKIPYIYSFSWALGVLLTFGSSIEPGNPEELSF